MNVISSTKITNHKLCDLIKELFGKVCIAISFNIAKFVSSKINTPYKVEWENKPKMQAEIEVIPKYIYAIQCAVFQHFCINVEWLLPKIFCQ